MAKKSFEQNIDRITEIADRLESGGGTLDESLKMYGEAVKLAKSLKTELDTAKGKILIMRKDLDGVLYCDEVCDD